MQINKRKYTTYQQQIVKRSLVNNAIPEKEMAIIYASLNGKCTNKTETLWLT